MKKLIFLIPFMLVLSSCGDDNSSTPSNINSDQTSGQATAGIGGGQAAQVAQPQTQQTHQTQVMMKAAHLPTQ